MSFTKHIISAARVCISIVFPFQSFSSAMCLLLCATLLLSVYYLLYHCWWTWTSAESNPVLSKSGTRVLGGQGTWCRKTGVQEIFFLKSTPDDTFLVSLALLMTSKVQLSANLFTNALKILTRRHPLLRACHLTVKGVDYLAEMKSPVIPLKVIHNGDWKEQIELGISSPYDRRAGPLWRAVLIENPSHCQYSNVAYPYQYAFVFSVHHAIYDSTSYLPLFRELMVTISDLKKSKISSADPITSLPVPLPLDMLHPRLKEKQMTFRDILMIFYRYLFTYKSNSVWLKRCPAPKINPNNPAMSCIIPVQFSSDVTANLISQCKKHNVTVHAALMIVGCVCVAEMLQGGHLQEDFVIPCISSISSKIHFPEYCASQDIGCYFACKSIQVSLKNDWRTNFWQIASDALCMLKDKLNECCLDYINGKKMQNWLASVGLLKRIVWRRATGQISIIFTNSRNCEWMNDDPDCPLKLRAIFLGQSMPCGPVFFNHVATVDNRLAWTVQCFSTISDVQTAQEYAERVKMMVEKLFQHDQGDNKIQNTK